MDEQRISTLYKAVFGKYGIVAHIVSVEGSMSVLRDTRTVVENEIKVIVASQKDKTNQTDVGDAGYYEVNFSVFEDGSVPEVKRVMKGKLIYIGDRRFHITEVHDRTLNGKIILKDCRAESIDMTGEKG